MFCPSARPATSDLDVTTFLIEGACLQNIIFVSNSAVILRKIRGEQRWLIVCLEFVQVKEERQNVVFPYGAAMALTPIRDDAPSC